MEVSLTDKVKPLLIGGLHLALNCKQTPAPQKALMIVLFAI